MMRKRIILFLFVSAMMWMRFAAAMAAEPELELILDKAELSQTDPVIEAQINIRCTEPMQGIQGTIAYNTSLLEVSTIEKGETIQESMAGSLDGATPGKINFVAAYAEPSAIQAGFCKVVFKLKDTADFKKSEVRIKYIKVIDANQEQHRLDDVYQYFNINTIIPFPKETVTPGSPSGIPSVTATPTPSAKPDKIYSFNGGSSDPDSVPAANGSVFEDVMGHWAKEDILFAYKKGFIQGVSKNYFEPDRAIKRAEFTKIIVLMLYPEESGENDFRDVPQGSWYERYISVAAKNKIVQGDNGYFRPDSVITRAELAVIAARILKAPAEISAETKFSDDSEIPVWAKDGVYQMVSAGVLKGDENRFDPQAGATRAQAVTVIRRIYQLNQERGSGE